MNRKVNGRSFRVDAKVSLKTKEKAREIAELKFNNKFSSAINFLIELGLGVYDKSNSGSSEIKDTQTKETGLKPLKKEGFED